MRPTFTFTLPNGDVATLNTYISFGEHNALNYIKNKDLSVADKDKELSEAIVKTVIVSVTTKDGVAVPNVLEYVSGLPFDDGATLFIKACEVSSGKKTLA